MEKKTIKQSFVGFLHVVKPIQEVFHSVCPDTDLDPEVLQVFCQLQKSLMEEMMNGASALAQHRNSDDVSPKDLLCHLDTKFKMDPLLVSENYCKVQETTEKRDISVPPKPLQKKKRVSACSNEKKTIPKVRKMSKKKLEMLAERERHMEICRRFVYKLPFDDLIPRKPPKPETQTSNTVTETQTSNFMDRPDIIEFFGNKRKRYNFDCVPEPSPVATTYKCKFEVEKNAPTCKNIMMKSVYAGKKPLSELKTEKEPSIKTCQNKPLVLPKTNLKQVTSGIGAIFKQPNDALICDPNSRILQKMTTCNLSMKVTPTKDESQLKTPDQPPIQMQGLKMFLKGKQEKSIECASVKNHELESKNDIETSLNPQVSKNEKGKAATNDTVETPEEARKKLAVILLRIAGKYRKDKK